MKYNTLVFTISLILCSQIASANPTGGQVVHGSATFFSPNTNVLNVTNSNNAIINWQSFNIGAGQTTNFIQPSSASSVLNRVISNNPSQLLGNLNSNGKVFLINQHGILVGAGAQVNTAGFFGSTLNITDTDYLNGQLKFEGDSAAGINNQGYIHAGENGNIVLIAPNIENGGVIEVDNGNVILAAGQSITISSLENPAIQFEVTGNENSVTNLGKILVNQGSASLFAGTLKHSGLIQAGGLVQNADGSISLVAKNSNQVSGEVDASGSKGGYIEILGESVNIESGANINASGDMAGGEILIGGDRQGLNPDIQNARSTTVSGEATVNADANIVGNGGKVIVFAEEDVHIHGGVSARGGAFNGDGGFIETSGLLSLDITSVPDASAVNGKGGEWLIDPNDLTISDNDNLITGYPDFISISEGASINVMTIQNALNVGTNVTVSTGTTGSNSQAGDISILSSITTTSIRDVSLTLNAHNDIIFDAESTLTNINISATGTGALNLVLNPNTGTGDLDTSLGQVYFKSINSTSAFNVELATNGGSLTVNGDTTISGSGSLKLQSTSWNVQQGRSVNIQASGLDLDTTSVLTNGGNINIDNASITGTGSIANKAIMSWANGAQLSLSGGVSLSSASSNAQFLGAGLLSLNNTSVFAVDIQPLVYDTTINWALVDGVVSEVENISVLPASVTMSDGSEIQGAGYLDIFSTSTSFIVDGGSFVGSDTQNPLKVSVVGSSIQVLQGKALTLNNTELAINANGGLVGGGRVSILSGAYLVANNPIQIAEIDLVGGTLSANNLTYAGKLLWDAGTVNGIGLTTSGHVELVSGVLSTDWQISPTGTVNWLSPDTSILQVINPYTIDNQGTFTFSDTVVASNEGMDKVSNLIETLFDNEGLYRQKMVESMSFVDKGASVETDDEEDDDDEKKRAPRLVCK